MRVQATKPVPLPPQVAYEKEAKQAHWLWEQHTKDAKEYARMSDTEASFGEYARSARFYRMGEEKREAGRAVVEAFREKWAGYEVRKVRRPMHFVYNCLACLYPFLQGLAAFLLALSMGGVITGWELMPSLWMGVLILTTLHIVAWEFE